MSLQARQRAKQWHKLPGCERMIICEQAFDVLKGDLVIAVYHPETGQSFAYTPEDLPPKTSKNYESALRHSIWNEALNHINPAQRQAAPDKADTPEQPRLFDQFYFF